MKIFFSLLLITISFIKCVNAQESSLTVVTSNSNMLQYQQDGKAVGPSVDILNMLLTEANLTAEIKFMPWTRAFQIAQTRPNTLIMSMVRNPAREAKFHWISKVSDTIKSFISLKENTSLKVTNMEELKQKVVAVVRGSVSVNFLINNGFSENKNLYLVSNTEKAIQLLLNKKVDLVFCDPSLFYYYFREKKLKSEDYINVNSIQSTKRSSYIALSKDSDSNLVAKLRAAQQVINKTDKYHYLVKFRPLISPTSK
ncbi:substrate-binding periplasmic protein [Colwelliaceae bacterium 6441]